MLHYIIKRLLSIIVTLWVIVTITFILMKAIPGDPFTDVRKVPDEIMANLKAKYGLDKPLYIQYLTYLKNIAQGNLGISIKYKNRSVNTMIKDGFKVSATLGAFAIVFGVSTGLILGIIAALYHQRIWDYTVILLAVLGISVPSFVFASLFQLIFGIKLQWLPVAKWGTAAHVILPMAALGFSVIAFQARMMRTSMLEVLSQDYIKTAKSKGLSWFQVIKNHVLRNAILPNITVLGPIIAGLLCGTFVIEKIFAIPGLGKYYINSIQEHDYTVIMGMTIFYSTVLLAVIFFIDIVYGLVDPRIRIHKKGSA